MKKHNSVITVVSKHQRKPTKSWLSPLSHDNRLYRCLFHFPLLCVLWFLSARLTPIGHYSFYFKRGIKAMYYKYQMWLSQLSSSDVMWLHKPPTVSLLPLDTPLSWFMMVNKQNTCWKRGHRAQKKGALINRPFSFSLYVFEVWFHECLRAQLETLWAADITTDHRTGYNVGVWLLGSSSEDIQWSWKLEI